MQLVCLLLFSLRFNLQKSITESPAAWLDDFLLQRKKNASASWWPFRLGCRPLVAVSSSPDVRTSSVHSHDAQHFHLELSKETSSEALWHSRRYERAISQATCQAEIAQNSLNPLKLQGAHSQQSILELQSQMGRASLEQPLDLNCDSGPESLFLEALCVPAPRTREDVGLEPTGEV